MSTSLVRRAALSAAAVCLVLPVTACTGQGAENGDAKGKGPGGVRALSGGELEERALVSGDLPARFTVRKGGAADVVPGSGVVTDKAACKPLAHAMAMVAIGKPGATARVKVAEMPATKPAASPDAAARAALDAPVTSVGLASYDGTGAQDAFRALRTSTGACAGGFTLTLMGETTKVLAVEPVAMPGKATLAWTVTSEVAGEPVISKVMAAYVRNHLATFSTVSPAGGPVAEPLDVLDAQTAKLRGARAVGS
ncbi:hypothetical protein [Streptomyces purpureus]|uniref:Lipoprotein n=1 Tax=Streptomyces purpureus TaxID=1951 RepID=A0A918HGZ1_9ACTN|nr:hypothetical protein [Streptomyces purpureus]GGT61219.1 lipoprotein [Streptomyces purpureus]